MTFPVVARLRSAMAELLLLPERLRSGIAYNPLAPRTVQDPYPAYAELRARAPVHRSRLLRGWVFTRYADVDAILRDYRRFGNDPRKGTLSARRLATLPLPNMLILDPPDHTRLRTLVDKAFTPRAVAALEPRIRGILGGLLDEIDDPSAFDLMEAVARPLPVTVIAETLGVPAEDRARFRIWTTRRALRLEPTIGRRERKAGDAAGAALDAYFRPVVESRRAAPRDDLLSALVQAQDEGSRLSARETLNMLRLILVAGTETTVNLIGNGLLALLRRPDQIERLREDPGLIPSAVEELLRFDAPVQLAFRRVLSDCEVKGARLRRRDNVVLALGAANRDPEVFEEPDRLDVGRNSKAHLAFGRGIHHCIGAPLARLEGRIVLEMLLERFRSMKLAGHCPRFRPTVVLRGLESLPVRCVPARRR